MIDFEVFWTIFVNGHFFPRDGDQKVLFEFLEADFDQILTATNPKVLFKWLELVYMFGL